MTIHDVRAFLSDVNVAGARAYGIGLDGPWLEGDGSEPGVRIAYDLDSNGEIAARYGVSGGFAVVVTDELGTVRWRSEVGGELPDAAKVASALRTQAEGSALSRRVFLTAAVATALVAAGRARATADTAAVAAPSGRLSISFRINGVDRTIAVDPRTTTAEALRDHLGLTGTKIGCAAGQCGACTILVDGEREVSCLSLAVMQSGRSLTTIEGISEGEHLHPMQRSFIEYDGLQCGFCTPGQIVSAVALVREGYAKTDDEIRESMSGNLCRCGAYVGIVAAIKAGRAAMRVS